MVAETLRARAITLGASTLGTYSRWYAGGVFYNPYGNQWVYTSAGPAALAASMFRATGDERYLRIAVDSFDYAVRELQHPDGYFNDVQPPTFAASSLEIYVFLVSIAQALYVLEDAIDRERAACWMRCVKSNIDHLEATGDIAWYANGNWVANKVRMLYLLAQISKRLRDDEHFRFYDDLYEWQVSFLMDPAPVDAKWTGFGLIVDTQGGWADWSDTLAHLSEFNGGPPVPNGGQGTSSDGQPPLGSYDGDYTGLQLDHIASWFAVSRDFRALRMLNGITNKYLAGVNTTTWVGDFSHGSRHNSPANGIYSPAFAVINLLAARQSNTTNFTDAKVLDQWDNKIIPVFAGFPNGNVPYGIARSFENTIGTILYACEQARANILV